MAASTGSRVLLSAAALSAAALSAAALASAALASMLEGVQSVAVYAEVSTQSSEVSVAIVLVLMADASDGESYVETNTLVGCAGPLPPPCSRVVKPASRAVGAGCRRRRSTSSRAISSASTTKANRPTISGIMYAAIPVLLLLSVGSLTAPGGPAATFVGSRMTVGKRTTDVLLVVAVVDMGADDDDADDADVEAATVGEDVGAVAVLGTSTDADVEVVALAVAAEVGVHAGIVAAGHSEASSSSALPQLAPASARQHLVARDVMQGTWQFAWVYGPPRAPSARQNHAPAPRDVVVEVGTVVVVDAHTGRASDAQSRSDTRSLAPQMPPAVARQHRTRRNESQAPSQCPRVYMPPRAPTCRQYHCGCREAAVDTPSYHVVVRPLPIVSVDVGAKFGVVVLM